MIAKASAGNDLLAKTAARTVALGADVVEASAKVLEAITRRDNPQSAVGVFRRRLAPLAALDLSGRNVVVALDRVRDPGNLGTVLRTADAAGATGVVLIGDCVDPFSLETVRATMGSIFSVPVARVERGRVPRLAQRTFPVSSSAPTWPARSTTGAPNGTPRRRSS